MRNARLDETQAEIKIAGRNINNLRYTDNTTLVAESKKELESLLMKVKEESEKADLKFSIQKTKIMASGPITSWQIDGETMETVTKVRESFWFTPKKGSDTSTHSPQKPAFKSFVFGSADKAMLKACQKLQCAAKLIGSF